MASAVDFGGGAVGGVTDAELPVGSYGAAGDGGAAVDSTVDGAVAVDGADVGVP